MIPRGSIHPRQREQPHRDGDESVASDDRLIENALQAGPIKDLAQLASRARISLPRALAAHDRVMARRMAARTQGQR